MQSHAHVLGSVSLSYTLKSMEDEEAGDDGDEESEPNEKAKVGSDSSAITSTVAELK